MKWGSIRAVEAVLVLCSLLFVLPTALGTEVTGQEKAMMIEAARADAYVQLTRIVKGLSIDSETVVGNFTLEEGVKEAATEANLVKGVELGPPRFLDDGKICAIPARITIKQVIENLEEIKRTHYNGKRAYHFKNIERYETFTTLTADGYGALREETPSTESGEDVEPQDVVSVSADGVLEQLEGTSQQKLGALEAAKLDAINELARMIKGVSLTSDTVVYNMATEEAWSQVDNTAFIRGYQIVRYDVVGDNIVMATAHIRIRELVESINWASKRFKSGRTYTEADIERYNRVRTFKAVGFGSIGDGTKRDQQVDLRFVGEVH